MLLQGILTKTVRAMNEIFDSHSSPNTPPVLPMHVWRRRPRRCLAVSSRQSLSFFQLCHPVILSGARPGGRSRKTPRLLKLTMLLQGILTKTMRAMNEISGSHSPPKNTAGAAHTRVAPPPPAVSCRFFAAFAAAFSLSNSATLSS